MRLVNKDITQEKIWVNVSNGEFYAEIFYKVRGKWKTEVYFRNYDFEIDRELCNSTIRYIIRECKLSNPKVFLAFGN